MYSVIYYMSGYIQRLSHIGLTGYSQWVIIITVSLVAMYSHKTELCKILANAIYPDVPTAQEGNPESRFKSDGSYCLVSVLDEQGI